MPPLSRWMVRAALAYLILGTTMGALLLLVKAGLADARMWPWIPAHADALIAGWMLQFAEGVGYWVLPRLGDRGRGARGPMWVSAILLNAGLLLAVGAPIATYALVWPYPIAAFAAGIAMQALALGAFVLHAWPRVRMLVLEVPEWKLRASGGTVGEHEVPRV